MPENRLFGENGRNSPYVAANGTVVAGGGREGAREFVGRRHREYLRWYNHWRFLLDSYEGGDVYRNAVYGWDIYGYPVMNLVRHKYEYDERGGAAQGSRSGYSPGFQDVGADPSKYATNNDYELRRARTPVPSFFREGVENHLSKIYAKEPAREGPPVLEAWWEDVDGKGTTIGAWVEQLVAPLGLTLANLDVLCDHPRAPEGEPVSTRADLERLGLKSVVASLILPENMLWWRLDLKDRYLECLVREWEDDAAGNPVERFRHWTGEASQLLDAEGEPVGDPVPHPYGRPPIVRLFDQKRPRERNVGQSRYENTAIRMREFYNRDSESILADTLQVHNLLQGPEDFVEGDGTLPIGPNWLLPKKKSNMGGTVSYEGFEVITFPTAGAESLRANKAEIRDAIDRDLGLTKPAGTGTPGGGAGVQRQTAEAKKLDNQDGGQKLTRISGVLTGWEEQVAELVLTVAADGNPDPADLEAVRVVYPLSFDLQTLDELIGGAAGFHDFLESAGQTPETDKAVGQKIVRQLAPGLDDAAYAAHDAELASLIDARAEEVVRRREGRLNAAAVVEPDPEPDTGGPSAQEDPVGGAYSTPIDVF